MMLLLCLLMLLLPLIFVFTDLQSQRKAFIQAVENILHNGTLESPKVCNATIISAFYHIKSKHSYDEYLTWMINFLSLTDCMVIFTQPDMVSTIKSMRGPQKSSNIVIIPRSIESFMMFQLLNKKQWEEQELMDPDHYPGHSK